ncbi:hypothetical protein Drorol1_Dr00006845 [Drosera rotundifolia]
MEGIQKAWSKISKDIEAASSSSSSAPSLSSIKAAGAGAPYSSSLSYAPAGALITRTPRNVVSLWTCSKLCAAFFVAGVLVGYTLKRRVKRWASKLLRRMKDD